jgi:hypothetical protein
MNCLSNKAPHMQSEFLISPVAEVAGLIIFPVQTSEIKEEETTTAP